MSASVGVALWREPLTATDLLARADRALLLAKRRGRDGYAVASGETELELTLMEERAGSPSALTREFWDMVSSSEHPREWFTTLPFFLRRTLDLQEVALYEPTGGSNSATLHRVTVAHPFGAPGRKAFSSPVLSGAPDQPGCLEIGALWRPRLAELYLALGMKPDEECLLAPTGTYAAVALARGEKLAGLLLMRSSAAHFPLAVLNLAELLATQAMTVLLGQTGEGSPAAVAALAAAIDARDDYTHEHSEQVVALACEVATALGLSPQEIERVRDGAMLHDVGKVAIPNEILYKPGQPDDGRVGGHAPAPGDRRAHPAPHPGARRHRRARSPRARALGRQRVSGRPRRPGDPRGKPDHPRLRRLQRDDHGPALPRSHVRARTPAPSCAGARARNSTPRWWPSCSGCSPSAPTLAARPSPGGGAGRLGVGRGGGRRARGLGVGQRHHRDRVGQPHPAVQAPVLRQIAAHQLSRLGLRVVAGPLGPARPPAVLVVEAHRERRCPGGDRQRHRIALAHGERAVQRELHGGPEVGLERHDRALPRHAPLQALARLEHADPRRGRAAEVLVEEGDLLGPRLGERDGPRDDLAGARGHRGTAHVARPSLVPGRAAHRQARGGGAARRRHRVRGELAELADAGRGHGGRQRKQHQRAHGNEKKPEPHGHGVFNTTLRRLLRFGDNAATRNGRKQRAESRKQRLGSGPVVCRLSSGPEAADGARARSSGR